MATNREAALSCLGSIADDSDALVLLAEAQVHALLDVADAIREQTSKIEVLVSEAQ